MKRAPILILLIAVCAGMAIAAEDTAEKTKKLADDLCSRECFKEAIKEYLKLVYLFEDTKYAAEAEYKVGECLQRSEKFWRAMSQWNEVISKYSGTEWAGKAKEGIKKTMLVIEDVNRKVQYPVTLREKLAYMYILYGNDFAGRCWVTKIGRAHV